MKYPEYFPLQEFKHKEADLPFEIHPFRWNDESVRAHNALPHRQNFIEIIWVTKGHSTLIVDMQKHEMPANSVYCVTSGQIHQLIGNEHTEGYIYQFTEDFLYMGEHEFDLMYHSGLFQALSRSAGIEVDSETAVEMKEITVKMMREADNLYLLRTELMRRYLKILLIYLTRQLRGTLQTTIQTRNIELVEKFKNMVEAMFKNKKKVADFARELSVTPNYLNEIVKKITGYPASHHIRQRVVLEAKRQAAYSDVCMKEVAWNLGFSDIAHFSKFFKNSTGTNFSDFKKECLVFSSAANNIF
ncbi:helix-turn-helix domain-containing protein [Chitinophaga sp.]|uniref:helix-turn-helix domain-containing protein n=1 Tax=Chitinophaga sp. TaxID=1869181 RepID=UPI0031D53735